MLGAIIGDIVGSRFEFHNHRSKEFELFTKDCFFTDDTVMTLAIAKALQESKPDYSDLEEQAVKYMRQIGRQYPDCGYGGRFYQWMFSDDPKPYNSFGNGAAMRVSACLDTIRTFSKDELRQLLSCTERVTAVTHNHPEGIKGAKAVIAAAILASSGRSIPEIKAYMDEHYYKVDFTLDEIRDSYKFDATCQGSVPQALAAFYESTGFEDAIRNAISIGGDSDTLAAITGTIAEEFYGIPARLQEMAFSYLDDRLLDLYEGFQEFLGVQYIDPMSLAGGEALLGYKKSFLEDQSLPNLQNFFGCLRDSVVMVPGRAVFTASDKKRFIEAIKEGVGAVFSNENEVLFQPEILEVEKGRFFPMFSNKLQIPQEYYDHLSVKEIPFCRCIELARMEGDLVGLVLDPFTDDFVVTMEMASVIELKRSSIRYRDENRDLSFEGHVVLDGLTKEELDEIFASLDSGPKS